MSLRIPEGRQFLCVLLSQEDAWALRELIKPFDAEPADLEWQISFVQRLYEAMLRMIVDDRPSLNVSLDVDDCLLINQHLKSGAYKGADQVLLQTWQVLHEWEYDEPYTGGDIAIHQAGRSTTAMEPRDLGEHAGGAELPVERAGTTVRGDTRTQLPDVQ